MNMKIISLSLFFILNCIIINATEINDVTLNGEWKLYYGQYNGNAPSGPDELTMSNWPDIPASVPGNVELDLLAAGIIDNPEVGNNIYDLRKYESFQWWYFREFDTPKTEPGEQVEIVFEGLDCFGTVWINDQLVGETDNMFIEHRFNITDLLKKQGKNTIYVKIDPAVSKAQNYIIGTIGSRSMLSPEQVNIRKAPHMYGWDIMPRLISAGLWRSVTLDIKKQVRIEQVYWMTNSVDVQGKHAQLILDWQLFTGYKTVEGLTMEVSLSKDHKMVYNDKYPLLSFCGRKNISLGNVQFWWPKSYGEPNLYDAAIKILNDKNEILDEQKQRVGIRTAELIHTDITTEKNPGEFVFKINGEKIFVRGTNWVPLDALHSRDKTHLKEAINMIVDLNCNMIRCWGGNVYEDNDFFDLCDENGIMVWQDFAMACTVYPQNNDFPERLRKEAIEIVLKLRKHPSLVLWSGDNEIDESVDWPFRKKIDPNLNRISREILPVVIWEYDPVRDFLPSSPYHSEEYFSGGSDKNIRPEVHLWGPRGYYKAPFYTETDAHFVSEIGYHGCPNLSSLEKMFTSEFVYPWDNDGNWNDEWQTKAVRPLPLYTGLDGRNSLMVKQVNALFGKCPEDLDQFIFASQATQAEAMKFFTELWRMDKFRKSGIIWWNLRDGWPIISDAVVDYYNSKKLAYYYIKQAQHNACIMVGDPVEGRHPVVAVNDTRELKSGTVTVRDADSSITLFAASFEIPANGKIVTGYIPGQEKQAMWLIDYKIGEENYSNHYLAGTAPFNLNDYQRWFEKLNIKRN
jgi:beta-mannosidase